MVAGTHSVIGVGLFFPLAASRRRPPEELMQELERYELCKLELKYCELCGRLWFRMKPVATAHCPACNRLAAELLPPRPLATCRTRRRP